MKFLKIILLIIIVTSCSSDNDSIVVDDTLSHYINNKTIETGAVIACAASDTNSEEILVFYYPEAGASNVRLYATLDTTVNSSDYSKYNLLSTQALPVFNGHLEKKPISSVNEKWIIITFELNDEIKISNPIKTKQESKPTVWNDNVDIDLSIPELPTFSWMHNPFGDNAIYFQVITDSENNLLSGTYTYENTFQYYNTSNVVINITTQTPPSLMSGATYKFTLMDVSLDNWVNHIVKKTFNIL